MKKKKFIPLIIITSLIVLAVLVSGYILYQKIVVKPFIEVKYYDENKNLITSTQQSMIGSIEGVAYISLNVNVKNSDTVPLTLYISSLLPTEVQSAIITNKSVVQPDKTVTFTTGLIDIQKYEGQTVNFCATVQADAIAALREKANVSGCILIKVDPNPTGKFIVDVTSSTSGPTVIPPVTCEENWICGEWSTCSNSIQTRTCTDANSCGTATNIPVASRACIQPFIKFRTSNLTYGTNSEIAITTNCSTVLIGKKRLTFLTSSSCNELVSSTGVGTYLYKIPCSVGTETNCYLGIYNGRYSVCWKNTSTSYAGTMYDTGTTTISTSALSINPGYEVPCS